MRVDSTAVTFGGVSELHYDLSDAEKQQKLEAAAAPLQAAQQVRLFNQEVRSELQTLRQSSLALADLDQVRKLIGGTSLVAEPIEPMERRGGLRDSMADSMSRAREELLLAESLVRSRGPPQSPAAQPTTLFQRPNTWSNVPVELSPEEQEEIRHKIYGSLVGAAENSAPKHQHPMDTEDSAIRERAEASRLRAALMRFDQDEAQSNSSFLSDADAQVEQHRSAMASQLEQMAYETERSRLQDAEQLAADEQELQRLKAEIAWNKRNVVDAARSEQTVRRSDQMHTELVQAKSDLRSVHRDEATLEMMRAKEVDLLQQTLKASQRRCSALDEEVRELREKLERRTQDGGRGGGNTQELEAELAKEKALRERYAALCVKLEKACESPGRGARDQAQVDTQALKDSVVQSEQMLREAESHARQRLAEAEREISVAKESAERSEGQAKENAEQLRNAQRALAAAERRSAALQEEKQATEEAMAVSVSAQEERISLLTRQLEEAEARASRASDVQHVGRLAQLEESLRSATAQKAEVERKLARSEQSMRELSRRAEQAAKQTQQAVAAQQAAEQALSQAQSAAGDGSASKQEQDAATRRAAAAEADKRRLQQELGAAHRQQAAQKAEVEKLTAQLAESKKSVAAQNGARRAHDAGQPSPKQKQKEERLLQAQQEMEGKLRKAWNDMKALQKRNTELLSEVQEATAAAQAASAEAEAARAHGGGSMRLSSPVRPYGGPSLHPGHASSLALLSHSGSSNRSSKVPQSTWVPTAAAVAAAVSPSGSMSSGVSATLVGWESRDSAKESIESWLGHALDVVGASVHVTTRDERKEWSTLATKLNTWLSGVTARTFTKVATDQELAKLAAATHSTLQATPGRTCHCPAPCQCLIEMLYGSATPCHLSRVRFCCTTWFIDSCTVWQIAVQARI